MGRARRWSPLSRLRKRAFKPWVACWGVLSLYFFTSAGLLIRAVGFWSLYGCLLFGRVQMGGFLATASVLFYGKLSAIFDFFLYGVISHLAGPLLFVFFFVVVVLVRITTPRLRIEAMGRLGWQPMF